MRYFSDRSRRSRFGTPFSRRPYSTLSRTVSHPNDVYAWKTMPRSRADAVHWLSIHFDRTGRRRQQSGHGLQNRGLAAPGRTEEDDDLAAARFVGNVEGDVANGFGGASEAIDVRHAQVTRSEAWRSADRVPAIAGRRCRGAIADRDRDRAGFAGGLGCLGCTHRLASRHRKRNPEIERITKSVSRPMPPMTSRPANDHDAFWCVRASSTM